MRLSRHFGDSYDVVKLLRWLHPLGPWVAHPMFTEAVPESEAAAFGRFLNVALLSTDQLTDRSDRSEYFAAARGCSSHLLLDPDTGISLKTMSRSRAPSYVFGTELQAIALGPDRLTLVFDQSLSRGGQRGALFDKLAGLRALGLSGFAYESHACFVVLSAKEESINEARMILKRESRLPDFRILVGPRKI